MRKFQSKVCIFVSPITEWEYMVFLLPHPASDVRSLCVCMCVSDSWISGNGSLVATVLETCEQNRSLTEVPLPSHTSLSFVFSHTCSLSLPEENERWLHFLLPSFFSLYHHLYNRLLIGCHLKHTALFPHFLHPLDLFPEFVSREGIQTQPDHL